MNCKKCGGKVIVDRMFCEQAHIELSCIGCGKRWYIKRGKGAFAKWLERKEENFATSI